MVEERQNAAFCWRDKIELEVKAVGGEHPYSPVGRKETKWLVQHAVAFPGGGVEMTWEESR